MVIDYKIVSNLQRAKGRAEIAFVKTGQLNRLVHLSQSGCLKALIPKNYSKIPDVVLINTSGGITGGDELEIHAELGEGSEVCVTTQTAERVYKAVNSTATIGVHLRLKDKSRLDWLPQETILFDNSNLKRSIHVDMSGNSNLFMVESILLGRKAMGESLSNFFFLDKWKIVRDNITVSLEALKLSDPSELMGSATLGGNTSLATILYVAPDAEIRINEMRAFLEQVNVVCAASAWNGKLVVRFASDQPHILRSALISVISKFRRAPLPRVWLM